MDIGAIKAAGHTSVEAVEATVLAPVQSVVSDDDLDVLAAEAGVSVDRLSLLEQGYGGSLKLTEIAAVLVATGAYDNPDRVVADLRESLLVWMGEAVVDVAAVTAAIPDRDEAQLREQLEGTTPMTVTEYAELVRYVVSNG